jgi:threonine dehydrogenase-like Zn-dependent dehydrogenase
MRALVYHGADQVFVVDRQSDRLRLATKLGAAPVDDSAGDAVQQALDATRGEGADKGVEAVGNVKQYNRQLRNLIHRDKLHPRPIVSHELSLDQAPEGYQRFDDREDGWTKVILHP